MRSTEQAQRRYEMNTVFSLENLKKKSSLKTEVYVVGFLKIKIGFEVTVENI